MEFEGLFNGIFLIVPIIGVLIPIIIITVVVVVVVKAVKNHKNIANEIQTEGKSVVENISDAFKNLTKEKVCSYCGTKLEKDEKVCPSCGAKDTKLK